MDICFALFVSAGMTLYSLLFLGMLKMGALKDEWVEKNAPFMVRRDKNER